jgi:LysM repeat protein
MRAVRLTILVSFVLCVAAPGRAQSLRGSTASLDRQYQQALRHGYTFLRRPADVQRFVELGLLVPIRPGPAYDLAQVSFPYARPEVKLFLERLGTQFKAACGEKLVVTSLVRPITRQPPNAAERSVHPTGMAVDLRRSSKASCRQWLERVLLQLEARGVLEATRESRPPHYHVALFPRPYVQYVAAMTGQSAERLLASVTPQRPARAARTVMVVANPGKAADVEVAMADDAAAPGGPNAEATGSVVIYRVQKGDSLWSIARRYGTTVARIKEENGLTSSKLMPRQVLRIPVGG